LWTRQPFTLFLESTKKEYLLGPTGDHATESFGETAIRVAAIGGATTLEVNATAGMSAGNYIGIELDSGAMHWTTIASVTDADTVVISAGLPSGAAVNRVVYFYATKIDRPLRLKNLHVRDDSDNDLMLAAMTQAQYLSIGDKDAKGTPGAWFFDPQLGNARLSLYPQPDDVTAVLRGIYQRPLEDVDAGVNNVDFPQEWLDTLKFQLAVRLAPEYGVPLEERRLLREEATMLLGEVLAFDTERAG
jgi:hypothetical protein